METPATKQKTFGLVGVVIGAIALGMALVHFWAGPVNKQPPLEEVVADKAVKIRDAVVAKLKGEEKTISPQERPFNWDKVITVSTNGRRSRDLVAPIAPVLDPAPICSDSPAL